MASFIRKTSYLLVLFPKQRILYSIKNQIGRFSSSKIQFVPNYQQKGKPIRVLKVWAVLSCSNNMNRYPYRYLYLRSKFSKSYDHHPTYF
jgi:hypothetical protein